MASGLLSWASVGSGHPAASLALSDKSDTSGSGVFRTLYFSFPKSVTAVSFSTKLYNCHGLSTRSQTFITLVTCHLFKSFSHVCLPFPRVDLESLPHLRELSLRKQEAISQVPLPDDNCGFVCLLVCFS